MKEDAPFRDITTLNCIAFLDGDRVPDSVLEEAVALATEGFITGAGMRLYLIPAQAYEKATKDQQAKADEYARSRRKYDPNLKPGPASPSIKKWDCIPLTFFLPKKRGSNKARVCENEESSPLIPRLPEGAKRNASTLVHIDAKRNATCPQCGESLAQKRRDAKFCCKACKQAAHRLGQRV